MAEYIGAIDQGTTSSRFIVFDRSGRIVTTAQKEHEQIYPKPGWVEHNPEEIWAHTQEVIAEALKAKNLTAKDLEGIGITNQRKTTVVWNKKTGKPVYNALVWQDTRTADYVAEYSRLGGQDQFRRKTGLPLATYFSGLKIKWILENVSGVRDLAEAGDVLFGNIDTYLIWQLTGGTKGGIHVTDVTNASRTQLMNLETLDWSTEITKVFGIPMAMLPKICSSSEVYGEAKIPSLAGVPVAGDLGDQQAALVGQTCFKVGEAKNTYGTGCFLLLNTGTKPVQSEFGLITTLAYKLGNEPATYALGRDGLVDRPGQRRVVADDGEPAGGSSSSGVPSPSITPSMTWRASRSFSVPAATRAEHPGDVCRGDHLSCPSRSRAWPARRATTYGHQPGKVTAATVPPRRLAPALRSASNSGSATTPRSAAPGGPTAGRAATYDCIPVVSADLVPTFGLEPFRRVPQRDQARQRGWRASVNRRRRNSKVSSRRCRARA